ncbi:DUF5455 family protein [Ferrimonas futtsuensis]|uniref:DUF5455 family protein n=1 Tax=Ferrimonas futtsuensis TaxID=364764 RepID=UPI000485D9A1|nr:DUF5455 family protein [Ferrimonas futtsuensis]
MPAILGLPALAAFIGALLTRMVAVFFSEKLIRIAYILSVAGVLYAAMKVLDNAVSGYIGDLLSGMPPEVSYLGILMPSNTAACIQACIATQFACTTYSFVNKAVLIKMKAAG